MGDEQVANRELKPEMTTTTTAVIRSLKRVDLRPYKLYRIYLDPLNSSNTNDFFLKLNSSVLYPGSKPGRNIRRRMFTSSIKRRIRLHVVLVQWTSKKCTLKPDARAELFCS